ncbi:MAG TPA: hypothetical protein VGD17_04335 [Chitinophagaceae bacterium]
MKSLFQPAVIAMIVVAGLASCKKEGIQPNDSTITPPEVEAGRSVNLNVAHNLVRKGTDSLVYNAGGTLTKVIYSPSVFVSYQKSGNILTASKFENNVLKAKVEYTLVNGRTSQSKHTSYESNVAVTKTWLYDYNADNRLIQKYNKDNSTERINFVWIGQDNLAVIKWFNGSNQQTAALQFTRNAQADKIKINSTRSGLDPYLKIFGTPCGIMSTGEDMTYPLSPASNFKESHSFTYDRDGYPVKVSVYDPTNWTLKYTQTFAYSN